MLLGRLGSTAVDAASVAAKAGGAGLAVLQTASVVGGGTAAASGGAVSGLLAAAGVSSTVPVAGWIAAGGMAAAAGTIAFVRAMRAGKLRRAGAVARARAYGIEGADEAPGFTVKVLRVAEKNPAKLVRMGERLRRKAKRKGFLGLRSRKKDAKIDAKVRIVAAVLLLQRAQARGHEAPAVPATVLEREHFTLSAETALPILLAVGGGLILFVALRGGAQKRTSSTERLP